MLVCRNRAGGYFYLPGGHVEAGESGGAALEREFAEETGLVVRAGRLVAVAECSFWQDGALRRERSELFLVEQFGSLASVSQAGWPEKVESREPALAFEWAPLDGIAGMDLRPRVIRDWLGEPGALASDRPVAHLCDIEPEPPHSAHIGDQPPERKPR